MSDYARWAESDQSPQAQLDQAMQVLLVDASALGLSESDNSQVYSMLQHQRHEHALEFMMEQMHEQGIRITSEFYRVVQAIATSMQLPEQHFMYAKELIK